MTKTMFDPKVHGYKDGLWTCQHIQWPDHGVTQGEHPPIDPCPWCEIDQLRAALKVAQQSLLEFSHAQECGPSWYTRGENGMYQQVNLWLRRGLEAVQGALGPYDDNGQYLKERPAAEPTESAKGI